jgi:hypothetical protein
VIRETLGGFLADARQPGKLCDEVVDESHRR